MRLEINVVASSITLKHGMQRDFAQSGHAGRLYVRGFLRLGSLEPLLPPKTTMKTGVRRVRKDERGRHKCDNPAFFTGRLGPA